MRTWALIVDSLREIYARKVIIGIVLIEVITLAITALILFSDGMQREYSDARMAGAGTGGARIDNPDDRGNLATDDSLLAEFGESTHADTVDSRDTTRSKSLESVTPASPRAERQSETLVVEEMVRGELGAFAIPTLLATLFLGIFAAAGIIPQMMEKGTIDLLLSKPLPRWKLLWGRAAGGAIAVGTNLLLFTLATYAVYGIASGVWYLPFVGLTFLLAFAMFLILFTGIIALNVTTESWVLPMSLAYIHLVLLSNFLTNREETIFRWVETPFLQTLITGLYYALPQTNDIIVLAPTAVLTGSITDWSPLIQGAIFSVAMIALATWRFQKKDF